MTRILVTGGAGYIGSHTCVELTQADYDIVVLDNLANSRRSVLDRLERISGRTVQFVEGDVRDREVLDRLFARYEISAVIHFAGLKSVGESVANPLEYYDNNVYGSIVLGESMAAHGVKTLVFSSSATVYGEPEKLPVPENAPLQPASPYAHSKLMVEDILRDLAKADSGWRIVLLRYFNPAGAHESGMIGEDPKGIPNNLVPYISQVAAGRLPRLEIFGNNYPTADGTGVRDYIHVVDLAQGHVAALRYLNGQSAGALTVNLGSGRGYSVLEVLRAFERVTNRRIAYSVVARRPGDVAAYYADPSLALERFGWRAHRDIETMCRDVWRWQQWVETNPAWDSPPLSDALGK